MNFYNRLTKKANDIFHTYKPLLLSKSQWQVECPACGWKGPEFLPNSLRPNARCPKCDSKERHRLYFLYLKEHIPANRSIRVLHFAPEKIITRLFKSFNNVEYLSADLDPNKAMTQEDITNTSFESNSFDIIFCAHVLEHIPDDIKAMRELFRVLKPGGFAILQVPIKDIYNGRVINKTYEDFSITDPKKREHVFGQHDHVRIYGRDFKDRLENAGFKVNIEKYADKIGQDKLRRFVLLPNDPTANETEGWIFKSTK